VFGGPVTQTFTNPQPSGAPLTFLRKQQDGDWRQVYLPVRPNGSTAWIRTIDVAQAPIPYRLEISTAAHQLRLYQASRRPLLLQRSSEAARPVLGRGRNSAVVHTLRRSSTARRLEPLC